MVAAEAGGCRILSPASMMERVGLGGREYEGEVEEGWYTEGVRVPKMAAWCGLMAREY